MLQSRGLCAGQQPLHHQQQYRQHDDKASAQQQQQQQQSGIEKANSFPNAVYYWLHAERLLHVPPAEWQQHLAGHLLGPARDGVSSSGAPRSGGDSSSSSGSSSSHMLLLADLACDWCSKPLPPQEDSNRHGSAAPASNSTTCSSSNGSSGSRGTSQQTVWGCPSCGAAQYCNKACADSAEKVHNANCW
jgi:hypothetical protein